jgi:hypothetical protein
VIFQTSSLPTNHLTLNSVPDLPPPELLERTQIGTHPTMAQSAPAILSSMGKAPTSLPEDRSGRPTFLSLGRLPKMGDPDPEEGAGEGAGEARGI